LLRLAWLSTRIAQEALANVAKYATSAPGESGSATGLPGLGQCADLLGGLLSADPDPFGSGWMVVRTPQLGSQSRRLRMDN